MEDQGTSQGNAVPDEDQAIAKNREIALKLGTMGWALFFIWIGVAFLLDFGIGIGLLGIGIITLGMQLLRGAYKLKIEGFWFVVGLLFALGGIWVLLEPSVPLVPILLIVCGLLLLLSIARGKRRAK